MASIESIEIVKFDPRHPLLSPDLNKRPVAVKSVGVFAVLEPDYGFFVAVYQGQNGWSIPAGRVKDTDTSPVEAALREFTEETNGGFDIRDITHMGIILRKSRLKPAASLVFRAIISPYNLGITHYIDEGQIAGVHGDNEVNFLTFIRVGGGLSAPVYRPDINVEVVRAFSQIKG